MKQQAEMSMFIKHVADKQQFPFFSDATVDIDMPSACTASSHAIQGISVAYLRKKHSLGPRDPECISLAE